MAQKKYLDYTQLSTFLAKLRDAFSASDHKHTKADITDFPTALKNPFSFTVNTNGITKATYDGSTAMSVDITAANVGAAALSHTHDDRYYTETEINTKIDAINDDITDLQNNKANVSHTHNYAGSDSVGGSALSAAKLDTDVAGSAIQPVYFSDGKPVATTYTLEASVPSGAKFTDTVYTLKPASTSVLGGVKPDGITITVDSDGVIKAVADTSNCVTLSQLKTILASAAINSDGKLTFTI